MLFREVFGDATLDVRTGVEDEEGEVGLIGWMERRREVRVGDVDDGESASRELLSAVEDDHVRPSVAVAGDDGGHGLEGEGEVFGFVFVDGEEKGVIEGETAGGVGTPGTRDVDLRPISGAAVFQGMNGFGFFVVGYENAGARGDVGDEPAEIGAEELPRIMAGGVDDDDATVDFADSHAFQRRDDGRLPFFETAAKVGLERFEEFHFLRAVVLAQRYGVARALCAVKMPFTAF